MLARLEVLKDEATVEVDRSGTLVRVRPPSKAGRVQAVLSEAGTKTEALDTRAGAAAVASATAWFSRATIRELSREEFRILSRRWTEEMKQGAQLSDEQGRRLLESLERAFDDAVNVIPPDQGIPRDPAVWRAAKARAIGQVVLEAADYLPPATLERVKSVLETKVPQ